MEEYFYSYIYFATAHKYRAKKICINVDISRRQTCNFNGPLQCKFCVYAATAAAVVVCWPQSHRHTTPRHTHKPYSKISKVELLFPIIGFATPPTKNEIGARARDLPSSFKADQNIVEKKQNVNHGKWNSKVNSDVLASNIFISFEAEWCD